jgi:hypothetical protein
MLLENYGSFTYIPRVVADGGQPSARGGRFGGKINILKFKKMWFSAIDKFKITEPNISKFHKCDFLIIVVTRPGHQNTRLHTFQKIIIWIALLLLLLLLLRFL